MDVARIIKPQEWMMAQEIRTVMAALGEGKALFVGGCVRNCILDAVVEDVDIATSLLPDDVMRVLNVAGVKVIPTGIEHGTVTAVLNAKKYEITTLRIDNKTDGRHAEVSFSKDWIADAKRRDFTMNTLLMNMVGQVFDPLGCGLRDLEAGRVEFVGNPVTRLEEDYLRILRFFRFHALYGRGDMSADALAACRAAAQNIDKLSRERVTQEFFKILSVDTPSAVLKIMFDNNILRDLLDCNLDVLEHVCKFQCDYNLRFLASRLFTLCGFDLKKMNNLKSLLLVPKVFIRDIQALDGVLELPDLSDDKAVKVAVYKFGRVAVAQALMIELATDRVTNAAVFKALKIVQKWDIPQFPISGNDLIAQGYEAGPALGAALERLEDEWIARGFKD